MSGFDPPPPSPPPPPSSQPPAGGFGPPAYAPPPPNVPVTPPQGKGPNKWLLAGIGALVVAAIVVVIVVASGGDDEKKTEVTIPRITLPTITTPNLSIPEVTLPDVTFPDVTLPGITLPDITEPEVSNPDVTAPSLGAATVVAATDGTQFAGPSGWTMQVPDSWRATDGSVEGAEAAWYTGGGDASFANNVAVITDSSALNASLEAYVTDGATQIARQVPGATVLDTAIVTTDTGAQYGRIHYTYTLSGVDGTIESIITTHHTSSQWLIGNFTALDTTFAGEVGTVEPYIATLTAP